MRRTLRLRDAGGYLAVEIHRTCSLLTWVLVGALALVLARPAVSAISYVQGTNQNPNSGNPIGVTFAAAQTAGDLNVVFVGWNDSTSTVQSITDTKGNTYVAAVGPTVSTGNASQRLYYAKNIVSAAAGANTVTVTFSGTVAYPDVRILEYSGIDPTNPFDVGVGASGTGATQSSGSLTTTNANDLLVASNYVADFTTASDANYTQRFITVGGEIAEDRVVTATGAYTAGSTQGGADWWLMQLAAFRAASGGDTQAPTAPTGLTATSASSTQINLSWTASTDNVGVTGYRVEDCSGASCTTFAQIATPTASTYSATGLSASTSYSFRVRATDAAGNLSGYSGTSTAVTSSGSDTQPPTAPTGLTATVASASQVNLSWTASTDNVGVTGYRVEDCSGASCTTFAQIATPTATAYNATGLSASSSYSFRIRANDAAGNLSAYSTTSGATTPAALPQSATSSTYAYDDLGRLTKVVYNNGTQTTFGLDAAGNRTTMVSALDTSTPSSAPTGLAGAPTTATNINLTWNACADSSGSTIAGYHIYRADRGSAPIGSSVTPSYSDSTVVGSTSYAYTVSCFDNANPANESPQSAPLTIASLDTTPPSVPAGLTGNAPTSNMVNLSWSASTDTGGSGLAGYNIYRAGVQIGTSTTATFSDATAVGTTLYSYTVSARDNRNNVSAQSSAFSITTPDTLAPSVPTGLSGSATSSTNVNLTWAASTDTGGSGLAGYKIFRGGAQIGTSATAAFSDTTTAGTTSYVYTVAAYDHSNNTSAASGAFSVTTPDTISPTQPTGLTATVISASQINLAWNASTDTGGSGIRNYLITRNGAALVYSTATTYSDTSVGGSTQYTYTVTAYDNAVNASAASAAAAATTPSNVPGVPDAPYPRNIVKTSPWLETWGTATGPVAYYILSRNDGPTTQNFTITAPTTSSSQSGGNGFTYAYKVQACNSSNVCSAFSSIETMTYCYNGVCP